MNVLTSRHRSWIAVGLALLYWVITLLTASAAYQAAYQDYLGPSPSVHWIRRHGWATQPLTLHYAREAGLHSAVTTLAAGLQIFLCLVLLAVLLRPLRDAAPRPSNGDSPDEPRGDR